MKIYKVIGLMSGTSLDGVDVALLHTDGEGHIEREAFLTIPYDEGLRAEIRTCFGTLPGQLSAKAKSVERAQTHIHARAVHKLLTTRNLQPKDIDLIGFHGQTVSHVPEKGYTCQIGDG